MCSYQKVILKQKHMQADLLARLYLWCIVAAVREDSHRHPFALRGPVHPVVDVVTSTASS